MRSKFLMTMNPINGIKEFNMGMKKTGTPEKIEIVKESDLKRLLKNVTGFDGELKKEEKKDKK